MRIFLSDLIEKPPWTIITQDSKGQLLKNNTINNSLNYYKEVKDYGVSSYDKKFTNNALKTNKKKISHRFDAFFIKK